MWVSYLFYSINIYVVDGYAGEPLSAMYPAVMSGDLGMVVKLQQEGQLRVDEKYHALTKHFLCCWPVIVARGKQQHSFQRNWLTKSIIIQWSSLLGEQRWRLLRILCIVWPGSILGAQLQGHARYSSTHWPKKGHRKVAWTLLWLSWQHTT